MEPSLGRLLVHNFKLDENNLNISLTLNVVQI
jgi:hypothetical protein